MGENNYCVANAGMTAEKPPVVECMARLMDVVARVDSLSTGLLYNIIGQTTPDIRNGVPETCGGLVSDLGMLFKRLKEIAEKLERIDSYVG